MPCVLVIAVLIALIGTGSRRGALPVFTLWRCCMAAKRDMLWLLVWRALRLRLQRVSVVFAALTVGAMIVTALSAVWFDINSKMSEELRTFGANFYIGPAHGSGMPQPELQAILDNALPDLFMAPVRGCMGWRAPNWKKW